MVFDPSSRSSINSYIKEIIIWDAVPWLAPFTFFPSKKGFLPVKSSNIMMPIWNLYLKTTNRQGSRTIRQGRPRGRSNPWCLWMSAETSLFCARVRSQSVEWTRQSRLEYFRASDLCVKSVPVNVVAAVEVRNCHCDFCRVRNCFLLRKFFVLLKQLLQVRLV